MKIARSTFYYRRKTSPEDTSIIGRIEAICLEFPGYGYRRVTRQLQDDKLIINHKKVLRLMKESDLLCRARRKRVVTTNSKHPFPRYPNLIKGMVVSGLNQVWLADITYIRIRNGFVYLAAILDAYSRRVMATPSPEAWRLPWRSRRSVWLSPTASPRPASFITPTRVSSTLPKST